jgi:hypothetical protein
LRIAGLKALKRVKLVVRQAQIGMMFPEGTQVLLEDEGSVLDAIRMADEEIKRKAGRFLVNKCKSLLHMVYHSEDGRFYKQVAIQAYAPSQPFLNVRENPRMPLPDQTTITLVPEGGCTTDWEEPAE